MDQVVDRRAIAGEELAIGIQFAVQFPQNKSLTLTTAYPLDSTPDEINRILKKLSDAADVLDARYQLRAMREFLQQTERQLLTQQEQINNAQQRMETEWVASNRRGPFAPSSSQTKELDNWKNTLANGKASVAKLKADIAVLEVKAGKE